MATTITITCTSPPPSQARKVCTCKSLPTRCRVCRTPTIFMEGSSDEQSLEPLEEEIDPICSAPSASATTTSAQSSNLLVPASKECAAASLRCLRRNYAQANLRERMFPSKPQETTFNPPSSCCP